MDIRTKWVIEHMIRSHDKNSKQNEKYIQVYTYISFVDWPTDQRTKYYILDPYRFEKPTYECIKWL